MAFLQVTFDRLASKAVIDYFRREKLDVKLLKNLKIRMLAINQLIDDAEDKLTINPAVKEWLDELKEVVFDTEDVLDVIATQALENEVSSTTPWNPFDRSLYQELEVVFDRMKCLLELKDVFGLKPSTRSNSTSDTLRLPTTSIVEQYDVYGRDEDKEEIKKLLLSNDGSNGGVVAIVGMGGLGKTTLAQLVFNDYEINSVFKLNKVWICVAEDFDVEKITKTILEKLTKQSCHTKDFDQVQIELKEIITGKKFLIVLDDVWNENSTNWDNLRKPFCFAAQGSKIIVTTRSETVAFAMRATSTYKLKSLSDEACWLLFSKHAFENIESTAYSTFKANVVKKCGGLPLAAKALGGLLGTKLHNEEWDEILRSSMWDLSDEVHPVLRLSYHYLSSNLKRCFAFCSLVPKGFDFVREKLVLLWMAENLLQDSKSKRRIDLGYQYLRDLESRSLIQPSTKGELYFSMHDLVNDLAKFVSGEFYKCLDLGNSFNVAEKTRHFSSLMIFVDDNGQARFKGVSEAKRLRTFLSLSQGIGRPLVSLSETWSQLSVLRSITLEQGGIKILPDSIGYLKLLRYLDLSRNTKLNELPECLASLHNLEVLNLNDCSSLTKLPECLGSLYNLKVLNLSGSESLTKLPESVASLYNLEVLNLSQCWSLTKLPSTMGQLIKLNYLNTHGAKLQEMPLQMGRLKDLDVLTDFVVGKGSGSSIRELKELKYLRGDLSIRGLHNISHPGDSLEVNLKEKSHLEKLSFIWGYSINSEDARIVLENLRPHVNLKTLCISGYSGTRLPDWSGNYYSFVNLVYIEVSNFEYCTDLSPLSRLPSLKTLTIDSCDSLVTLVGTEIPIELPNESHHHVGHFSALVSLKTYDCPMLELPQHHCFTSIEDLTLDCGSCASLRFFLLCLVPKVKNLRLCYSYIESLAVVDEVNNINLEYLEFIEIDNCPNFEYFNAGKWCAPKLTGLRLHNCESLKVLPEIMCNLFPSLLKLELTQCTNLEALPQSGLPCSLRILEIDGCNKLVANRSSWGLQRLLSLSTLKIENYKCDDLESFPEEGLLPSSLSSLWIENAPNLRRLNGKSFQLLTSLETLSLLYCPNLECLPEERLPTSLSTLTIRMCPLLASRCQREQGEDWSKIAHIPNI